MTTPTPKHPDPKHPSNQPQRQPVNQPVNQPAGSSQRPQGQAVDPSKGKDPNQPSGIDPNYNTKPQPDADGGNAGGDQSPHPSPATDPTNAAPEPAQWTKDNPRPPLPKGRDYVAGQPVSQEEYELTEREQAERVRPEAWERLEGQGVEVEEGMKDASSGWAEGSRPDGKRLRNPTDKDDDVNKSPGGMGGQGTRADGRTRSPDMPGEGPNDRGERPQGEADRRL